MYNNLMQADKALYGYFAHVHCSKIFDFVQARATHGHLNINNVIFHVSYPLKVLLPFGHFSFQIP